jgi:hypothetical protein
MAKDVLCVDEYSRRNGLVNCDTTAVEDGCRKLLDEGAKEKAETRRAFHTNNAKE